jgi:hypothetical protein
VPFTGDVTDDIDSPELVINRSVQSSDLFDVRNVALDWNSAPTERFDLTGRYLGSYKVDICQHNIGTGLGEA